MHKQQFITHFIQIKSVLIRPLTSSITTSFRVLKFTNTWQEHTKVSLRCRDHSAGEEVRYFLRSPMRLSTSPWRLETPRLNTSKGFEYLFSELTYCKSFEIGIMRTRSRVSHVYDLPRAYTRVTYYIT